MWTRRRPCPPEQRLISIVRPFFALVGGLGHYDAVGRRRSSWPTARWVAGLVVSAVLTLIGSVVFLARQTLSAADQWASIGSFVVTFVFGVSGLVVSALGLRAALQQGPGSGPTARRFEEDLLEQLAMAVQTQWDSEAQVRSVNHPLPLAVRWSAADPVVMDRIATIVGEQVLVEDEEWVRRLYFSGQLKEVADVFAQLPTGRLVVLGQPGAGKTVLAMQLTRDLLRRRRHGQPVPVLLPIASWNPNTEHIHAWIAAQLEEAYPTLRKRSILRDVTMALHLAQTHRILPILDGLDEMAPELRAASIRSLNRALGSTEPLVLTSRPIEFRQAVKGGSQDEEESSAQINRPLVAAAVVELLPLKLDDIKVYLWEATPEHEVPKWDAVFDRLRHEPDGPLALAMSTPLMTALARVAYSETTANPAELLDERLNERSDIEEHLLDRLVPAAYADEMRADSRPCRWTSTQAQNWLQFLANHLDRLGSRDLLWWQIDQAVPRRTIAMMAGLVGGLAYGIAGGLVYELLRDQYIYGPTIAMIAARAPAFGIAFGLLIAFGSESAKNSSSATRWLRRKFRFDTGQLMNACAAVSLMIGFIPRFVIALVDGTKLDKKMSFLQELTFGLTISLIDGLTLALVMTLITVLTARVVDSITPPSRKIGLRGGLGPITARLAIGVGAGVAGGLTVAVVDGLAVDQMMDDPGRFRVGLTYVLVIGLLAGVANSLPALRLRIGLRADFGRVAGRLAIGLGGGVVGGLVGAFLGFVVGDDGLPLTSLTYYYVKFVVTDGSVIGLLTGLIIGLMAVFAGDFRPTRVETRVRVDFSRLARRLAVGLGAGLAGGLATGLLIGFVYIGFRYDRYEGSGVPIISWLGNTLVFALQGWEPSWEHQAPWAPLLWYGVMPGLAGGIAIGLVSGLVSEIRDAISIPADLTRVVSPSSGWRADRHAAIAQGIVAALAGGLTIALVHFLSVFPQFSMRFVLAEGLVNGLLFGFAGAGLTAWARFTLARLCLRTQDNVPWSLISFLEDAYGRGLLRRVGPAYQFRHARLQDHLARVHQVRGLRNQHVTLPTRPSR